MSEIKAKLLAKASSVLDGPMTLDKAILIAVLGHAGVEDKGENSYIRHPLRVMEQMDSEDEMIPAVLHDVPEDTFITLADLTELGCTQTQTKTIDSVTKREGESYTDRIERVKRSYVGRKIKAKDIRDNLALWRLKSRKLAPKDVERMQHYIDALADLGELDKCK